MTIGLLMPDFIVVGAARSGTSSLYQWLKAHPQVFMSPVKETNYFSHMQLGISGPGDDKILTAPLEKTLDGTLLERHAALISKWEGYLALFAGSEAFTVRGEASPSYLYYPDTAARIRTALPKCKIIIVLRNPIERAFSNHKALAGSRREHLDFESALGMDKQRMKNGWEHFWDLKGLGLYYGQVKQYLDLFPREQVGIWLYEELQSDPSEFYHEVCRFLGVDDRFTPYFSKCNVSKPQVGKLRRFLSKHRNVEKTIRKVVPRPLRSIFGSMDNAILSEPLVMKPDTRKYLLEYYRNDILNLQELLPQLNFTHWIEEEEREMNSAQ